MRRRRSRNSKPKWTVQLCLQPGEPSTVSAFRLDKRWQAKGTHQIPNNIDDFCLGKGEGPKWKSYLEETRKVPETVARVRAKRAVRSTSGHVHHGERRYDRDGDDDAHKGERPQEEQKPESATSPFCCSQIGPGFPPWLGPPSLNAAALGLGMRTFGVCCRRRCRRRARLMRLRE